MERMGEMYGNRGGPPMSERRGGAASTVGCRRTWREGKRDRKGREVRGRRGREREREGRGGASTPSCGPRPRPHLRREEKVGRERTRRRSRGRRDGRLRERVDKISQ